MCRKSDQQRLLIIKAKTYYSQIQQQYPFSVTHTGYQPTLVDSKRKSTTTFPNFCKGESERFVVTKLEFAEFC